ncbi:amino acid ABC transporter permease [Sediminispirochaeta smaragdinae]|uniref:Putative glutamine transport system permease protein GlnP n=1 Tax=Sediminispirochaeta smaragdinae (strain DSM 11293 / JCM 15392 / SEBR 4228) TaxID=573413 RepID=E1RBE1_SEDSS|nr:polar amino acid ABC transporter, inner membrane subunit [Sediminispirochaeta smaragdinae DSM 11293]
MEHIFPWDFSVIPAKFLLFRDAALLTLEITTLGILTGLVLGLIAALGTISRNKVAHGVSSAYIFLIRGTPLLLQLFIIYYGLTTVVTIPPFPSAIIALGVHNGAYIAEIFRGSIQSIHYGQMEAARSLGMPRRKAMRRIILPQAFKRAVPSLGNQFIIALKDSSLASTIAVPELLLKGRQLGSSTFMYMEMLIIVAIWYLIMTSVLTIGVHRLEKRLRVSDRDQI